MGKEVVFFLLGFFYLISFCIDVKEGNFVVMFFNFFVIVCFDFFFECLCGDCFLVNSCVELNLFVFFEIKGCYV